MVLSSYSKINLSLTINSKRKNNMHDIQSFEKEYKVGRVLLSGAHIVMQQSVFLKLNSV